MHLHVIGREKCPAHVLYAKHSPIRSSVVDQRLSTVGFSLLPPG